MKYMEIYKRRNVYLQRQLAFDVVDFVSLYIFYLIVFGVLVCEALNVEQGRSLLHLTFNHQFLIDLTINDRKLENYEIKFRIFL